MTVTLSPANVQEILSRWSRFLERQRRGPDAGRRRRSAPAVRASPVRDSPGLGAAPDHLLH